MIPHKISARLVRPDGDSLCYQYFDWDFASAEEGVKRAMDIYNWMLGHHAEAVADSGFLLDFYNATVEDWQNEPRAYAGALPVTELVREMDSLTAKLKAYLRLRYDTDSGELDLQDDDAVKEVVSGAIDDRLAQLNREIAAGVNGLARVIHDAALWGSGLIKARDG